MVITGRTEFEPSAILEVGLKVQIIQSCQQKYSAVLFAKSERRKKHTSNSGLFPSRDISNF